LLGSARAPPPPFVVEIMQTCLSEAFESYPAEIVVQLPSNTHAEMEDAADKVKAWVEQWVSEHAGESSANE
jgi:broad-specificity NMP kinase